MKKVYLTEMKQGETGTVAGLQAGYGLARRLESLGIRPGAKITKLSSQLMRGPITIQVGNTQVAVGFGMARKILIEKDE